MTPHLLSRLVTLNAEERHSAWLLSVAPSWMVKGTTHALFGFIHVAINNNARLVSGSGNHLLDL